MQISRPSARDLQRFPHMSFSDIPVWKKFLEIFPNRFQDFAYDVRVGKGIQPLPNIQAKYEFDWKALTQKRIDVVGYSNFSISIIEVKDIATVSAPGQVLAYTILYKQTFPTQKKLYPLLVYSRASRDVLEAAKRLNVLTEHIPI